MNKKIIVVLINLILILFFTTNTVWGIKVIDSINTAGYYTLATSDGIKDLKSEGGRIVGIIQVVGTVVAIGMLTVVGIKYVLGSAEEKASYKKTMLSYVIGAVLIFGFSNITQVIYNITREITDDKSETQIAIETIEAGNLEELDVASFLELTINFDKYLDAGISDNNEYNEAMENSKSIIDEWARRSNSINNYIYCAVTDLPGSSLKIENISDKLLSEITDTDGCLQYVTGVYYDSNMNFLLRSELKNEWKRRGIDSYCGFFYTVSDGQFVSNYDEYYKKYGINNSHLLYEYFAKELERTTRYGFVGTYFQGEY